MVGHSSSPTDPVGGSFDDSFKSEVKQCLQDIDFKVLLR